MIPTKLKITLQSCLRFYKSVRIALFGFDNYPSLWFTSLTAFDRKASHPLCVPPISKPPTRPTLLFNDLRVRIWSYIAKKVPGFKAYYPSKLGINYYPENPILDDLNKKGTSIIQNFLSAEEYKFFMHTLDPLITTFKSEYTQSKNHDEYWYNAYKPLPEELNKILNTKISPIIKPIFKKSTSPYIAVNYQKCESSKYYHDCTTYWHCDRFIPCIVIMYYPIGADWMPTQRVQMSPQIPSHQYAKGLQYHYNDINDYAPSFGKDILSQICKPNTLYISFHHIMHRRSVTNRPGERLTIFIDYYNEFTRANLLSSFIGGLVKYPYL